jgi:hypothetical protein
MAKVLYIRVRPKDPEADDLGWAVVLNGRFVATDSPYETGPCCEEIAQDVAIALECGYKEREVIVPDDWNWDDHVLPQVAQEEAQPTEGLFVTYTIRYGEDEALCRVALEVHPGEDPEEVTHRYFRDFFGDGTVCEKKAVEYWRADECAVLKVSTWRKVPPHEFAVLRKYL